jgi:hypothetical protein
MGDPRHVFDTCRSCSGFEKERSCFFDVTGIKSDKPVQATFSNMSAFKICYDCGGSCFQTLEDKRIGSNSWSGRQSGITLAAPPFRPKLLPNAVANNFKHGINATWMSPPLPAFIQSPPGTDAFLRQISEACSRQNLRFPATLGLISVNSDTSIDTISDGKY